MERHRVQQVSFLCDGHATQNHTATAPATLRVFFKRNLTHLAHQHTKTQSEMQTAFQRKGAVRPAPQFSVFGCLESRHRRGFSVAEGDRCAAAAGQE
jgi:hypothetical protein